MNVLERIHAWQDPALCTHVPASVPEPGVGGLHFVVKDNIDVAGMPTTAGCPSFAYTPTIDATVVARLRSAGHVPVAKTNLDQFATGLVGTRSPYGTPRNPFDALRIPGGSSSGSACAVAAGVVPFALGTDTAGSGRVPAALQNLVGLKPTKGWLSTRGVVPAVRSLDCVSVFAKSVGLAYTITQTAAGFDELDAFSRPRPELMLPRGALRLGIPTAAHLDGIVEPPLLDVYRRACEVLRSFGHTLVEIDYAPFLNAANLLYGGAWVAERTAGVGDFLDRMPADADPVVSAIIRKGRLLDAVAAWSGTYQLAEHARHATREWQRMDILVLPTVSTYPTLAEVATDPVGVNNRLGRFTNFANLLDTCALALPAGFLAAPEAHLPSGITLFAPAWQDGLLARVGAQFCGEPHVPGLAEGGIIVAVFGAHLRGQPRNSQLLDLGGHFVATCQTAPVYRMRRIRGSMERPGLVRVTDGGATIAGELWRLPTAGFGHLVASVTAPLAIGSVTLTDGTEVPGFICEGYAAGDDITAYGSWPNFMARTT